MSITTEEAMLALWTSEESMAKERYNLLYNPNPMDVTIKDMPGEDGKMKDITLPNMAKEKKKIDDFITKAKATNGGVNLYKNSRFLDLNDDGNHPNGFYHFYAHGDPIYTIVKPDFKATNGDGKIAADLVKLVSDSSWFNTTFNCLKVTCKGTKDTTNKPWTLNQNVFKGRGPLTRGCYVYMKPSSVSNTSIGFQIRDNPASSDSALHKETNTPIKVMGQGITNGHYLGFNLNVYLQDVNSNETVEFYIVAPFFVEGFVDGYRTSISDFNK